MSKTRQQRFLALALSAGLAWPSGARAADKATADPVPGPAFTLGEVVVTGSAAESLPASVTILSGERFRNEVVDESQDLLKKVPGVMVGDFNQGIISSDVGVRGFNTEGATPSTKLLIDGIPSNIHVGLNNLRELFPLEIERVEVVRGTADPRYGLYAVSGSINVETKEGGDRLEAKTLYGSFATTENQALLAKEVGPVSHTLFVGYRNQGGFRAHSRQDKFSLSDKLFVRLGDAWRAGLVFRAYEMDAEASGYLTASNRPKDNPSLSLAFAQADGGEQSNRHGSLHLDGKLGERTDVSIKAYAQSFVRHRFVRFDQAFGQTERVEDESQTGAVATVTHKVDALDAVLSAGLDHQKQDNLFERFTTVDRRRTGKNRDQKYDVLNAGGFFNADAAVHRWVRISAGARYDRLSGDFNNRLTGAARPAIDYGAIWQPKYGVTATPDERISLYGNLGYTFGTGVRDGLYNAVKLPYSRNKGWEAGVKASLPGRAALRLARWSQVNADEVRVIFNAPVDSASLGRTLRRGWDLELSVDPLQSVSLWGSWTRQDSRLLNPGAAFPGLLGAEIDHTPRHTVKAGVDVRPAEGLTASLSFSAQGDYHLVSADNYGGTALTTLGDRYGAYELADLDVTWDVKALTFGFHVKNLFDRSTAYVWYQAGVAEPVQAGPGDPRAFYVSAASRFGAR